MRWRVKVDDRHEFCSDHNKPEQNLLVAFLARALADLDSSDSYIVKSALRWFADNNASSDCFRYSYIIEELQLKDSDIKLIEQKVWVTRYGDKRLRERQKSRKRYRHMVERKRMQVSEKERPALRKACTGK